MAFTGLEKLALANQQIARMNAEVKAANDEIDKIMDSGDASLAAQKRKKELGYIANDTVKEIMATENRIDEEIKPQIAREAAAAKPPVVPPPEPEPEPKADPVYTDDSEATPTEIVGEWKNVPGVEGAKTLTVQSDSMFEGLPPAASDAVASADQKASEIAHAIGGQGTQATVTPTNAASSTMKKNFTTEDFKMKLRSMQNGATIIFNVSPTIDESRSANYEHLSPVHHPGTIQVYKNTEARQFNITVKLIARTASEASANVRYINLIRAWVMPYYGQGTANSSDTYDSRRLGGPPDILVFDVYGDKNISNLPVVLTSYHWVYPENVDYIPTEEGIPFPTIMDISLSLIESYSPEQYTNFNITSYRTGDMVGAYGFSATPTMTILPDADMAENREADMRALIESLDGDY